MAAGIAIEVTHRPKRRLFGLQGLTLLREVVRPPYRPDPELGRGRPCREIEADVPETPPDQPAEDPPIETEMVSRPSRPPLFPVRKAG